MGLIAEEAVSGSLPVILSDVANSTEIENPEQFRDFLCGLEYFVPAVLGEIHPEWTDESLDGVIHYVARKTADQEAEIIGHCILITDQTTTPFYLRLQLAQVVDEVSWLELRLGEKGDNGTVRTPYGNPPSLRRVAGLKDGIDTID